MNKWMKNTPTPWVACLVEGKGLIVDGGEHWIWSLHEQWREGRCWGSREFWINGPDGTRWTRDWIRPCQRSRVWSWPTHGNSQSLRSFLFNTRVIIPTLVARDRKLDLRWLRQKGDLLTRATEIPVGGLVQEHEKDVMTQFFSIS